MYMFSDADGNVLQNAKGAIRRAEELPHKFCDRTGGICGEYEGQAVRVFVMNVPQYCINEGGSRVGAMPLILAVCLATRSNSEVIARCLDTVRRALDRRFGVEEGQ